ncbi:MAG: fluoride efflux transporter CrcB [Candidatus Sericytochromatia bacterium]|nr:fluoride efflux transporter CrcB [Candidatus Sericytochromatia bacterium]
MQHFFLIGLGGWLGAYSRYQLGLWIAARWGTGFPFGTFVINVSGCLLLGFFGTWALIRPVAVPLEWRLVVAVGFLGAYTTFSTFGWESLQLFKNGQTLAAFANVLGSVTMGLLAVWLGTLAAKAVA